MTISVPITMLPKFVLSFVNYSSTDLNGDAFELPFPYWWVSETDRFYANTSNFKLIDFHRFPFNWKNPCGYVVAFTFQYIVVMYCYYLIACSVSFGTGSFLLVTSMVIDIQNNLNSINKRVKKSKKAVETIKQFNCTIHFHSTVKQLGSYKLLIVSLSHQIDFFLLFVDFRFLYDISKMAEPFLMIIVSSVMITTCDAMLLIRMEIVEFNLII